MKTRLSFTILIAAALLAAGPALASDPFCVTFQDIDSGGWDPSCNPEASQGFEYHHLMARELQGGTPGPLEHRQVIFTKRWDQGDPQLWQRLDSGAVIPEVTFRFIRPGGGGGPPEIIILTNARVLGIEPIIPHSADPDHTNYGRQSRIRMDYQTISIEVNGVGPVVLSSNPTP